MDRAKLRKVLSACLEYACFYVGRRDLLVGNGEAAGHHFPGASRRWGAKTKAKAFVGLMCFALVFDPERGAQLAGRPGLR